MSKQAEEHIYHLTHKELEQNTELFKAYLSSEGVDASLWQTLKTENKEKVEDHIANFSKLFADHLNSYSHFKFVDENKVRIIHFRTNDFVIVTLESGISKGDIVNSNNEEDAFIVMATKPYLKSRKQTIFLHYKLGFRSTDATQFNKLCLQYVASKD